MPVKMHVHNMRISEGIREIYHYLPPKALSNIILMFSKNLYNLNIFEGLGHDSIGRIIPILKPCSYPENQTIYRQNQTASHFYILIAGEVVVKHKPYDGEEITIARVCPEDVIGWSAALGRPKYTSSAYTLGPCDMVCIEVSGMQNFCRSNPQLGKIIMEKLAMGISYRLKSTYDDVLALLTHGMETFPEK